MGLSERPRRPPRVHRRPSAARLTGRPHGGQRAPRSGEEEASGSIATGGPRRHGNLPEATLNLTQPEARERRTRREDLRCPGGVSRAAFSPSARARLTAAPLPAEARARSTDDLAPSPGKPRKTAVRTLGGTCRGRRSSSELSWPIFVPSAGRLSSRLRGDRPVHCAPPAQNRHGAR